MEVTNDEELHNLRVSKKKTTIPAHDWWWPDEQGELLWWNSCEWCALGKLICSNNYSDLKVPQLLENKTRCEGTYSTCAETGHDPHVWATTASATNQWDTINIKWRKAKNSKRNVTVTAEEMPPQFNVISIRRRYFSLFTCIFHPEVFSLITPICLLSLLNMSRSVT